jgi:hypothetical protein
LSLAAVAATGLAASTANAAYLSGSLNPGRVIYFTYYLSGGVYHEIKTANLSGKSDRVSLVTNMNTAERSQVPQRSFQRSYLLEDRIA